MLLWNDIFNKNIDLYGAYTQMSLWQIYNNSSPFRETNYEPELFLKFDTDFNVLGLRNRLFLFGFDHQSNGQSGAFSRSWNRIYIEFIASRGNFVIGLKPWYRIPEKEEDDDNPDIEKYLGYGQLWGAYKWKDVVFSFLFRNNLRTDENKCGIEAGCSYGLTHNLRIYLQYFNGYGESLIDYNNSTNRIGLGFMINDWL
jgi:phospholipase A1